MPHLERNDVSLKYTLAGSGPPVMLSHGFSATSRMWDNQSETFADTHRVLTWDMRGHGQTQGPEAQAGYSEAETVADMAALLDACEIDRAVIGGLSLGGYMSLAFYNAHSDRVRALMLFDTGPGYRNPDARAKWNERAEQWATTLESDGLDAFKTMGTDEMRADWHDSAEGLAKAARGMLAQFDSAVLESLPNVTVPTLVLVGENDTPFIPPSEYMAKKIPNAEYVVIPDAAHAANMHNPTAFNAAVLSFLNGLGE